jgi:hypothetical protein
MNDANPYRRSIIKRSIGVSLASAPAVLAVGSILSDRSPYSVTAGISLGSIGFLIAVFNVWLSFIRPSLWKRRHDTMEGYRHVSGIPGFGTIFAILACAVGFGSDVAAMLALAALVLDTGGLPWFVWATWSDKSFWDDKIQSIDEQAVGCNRR